MKRNLWTHDETNVMLEVMDEKESIKLFDGKKHRNYEIFRAVGEGMIDRGYSYKNANQIAVRWKNLKCQYYRAKRQNYENDTPTDSFPYYEKLDCMLNFLPLRLPNIIKEDQDSKNEEDICENDDDSDHKDFKYHNQFHSENDDNDIDEELLIPKKRKRKLQSFNLDEITSNLHKSHEKMNEDFFKKQKELIKYEFDLYAKQEEKYEAKLRETIRETTREFIREIKTLISGSDENNIIEEEEHCY